MSQTAGITGNPLLQTLLGSTNKISADRANVASAANAKPSSIGADKTAFSGAGSVLAASDPDGDVRTGKVAALQSAIANGSYHVPAAVTADKLIGSLLR